VSTDTVFDQDATPVVAVNDHLTVRPAVDVPGWEYRCTDPKCQLTGGGTRVHGLAGFAARGMAVEVATEHVKAFREGRAVIA
jgi:hypothetical protein